MRPLLARTFDVGILAHLKLDSLAFQHGLKFVGQKLFALFCSKPDGAVAASVPRVPQGGLECRRHGSAYLELQWDHVQKFAKCVNDCQYVLVTVVKSAEGPHVHQIAFPHVHHVRHRVGIARESLAHLPVQRVRILLLYSRPDRLFFVLHGRRLQFLDGRECRQPGWIIIESTCHTSPTCGVARIRYPAPAWSGAGRV